MQFQTILAVLPILVSLTTAAPVEATSLTIGASEAIADADKFCLFTKCIGKSGGKSKCNIEQCFSAAAPIASTCAKAALKATADIFDKVQCATSLVALGGNMPGTCKDCLGQLKNLVA